jgi:hypothetical protein
MVSTKIQNDKTSLSTVPSAEWNWIGDLFNGITQSTDFVISGTISASEFTKAGVPVVTSSGSETLSNKTLTAPKIVSGGFIATSSGAEQLKFTSSSTPVNEFTLNNSDSGVPPKLEVTGDDANISLGLQTKGTGTYRLNGTADKQATLRFSEQTTNGSSYIELQTAADLASSGTLTIPSVVSDTMVARATTDTLSNKRITQRTVTVTAAATPTVNSDNTDVASITGLSMAITDMSTNLTGTPAANDEIHYSITDNGTARALTWGAKFEASTITLPTTTVINARLDCRFKWNTVTSKWRLMWKA